jgi:hypothetical protein
MQFCGGHGRNVGRFWVADKARARRAQASCLVICEYDDEDSRSGSARRFPRILSPCRRCRLYCVASGGVRGDGGCRSGRLRSADLYRSGPRVYGLSVHLECGRRDRSVYARVYLRAQRGIADHFHRRANLFERGRGTDSRADLFLWSHDHYYQHDVDDQHHDGDVVCLR